MAYLEYNPTAPLFHYCGEAAFRSIIQSKEIWFAERNTGNDPREIHFPRTEILAALRRYDRLELPPEGREALREMIANLVPYLYRQQLYTFCTTPLRDDHRMWMEYGDRGKGLSFSVRPRAIRDLPLRIQRLNYVDTDDTGYFDEIVATAIDPLRYVLDSSVSVSSQLEFSIALIAAIMSTKDIGWEHEKEVRLSFANSGGPDAMISELPDGSPVYAHTPFERVVGDQTVRYCKFGFGLFKDGSFDHRKAVAEVIVGGECATDVEEVIELLHSEGYEDVSVQRSRRRMT